MHDQYVDLIRKAYENINFVTRFEEILTHTDFNNRVTRIDTKETLKALRELGYNFKVMTPGSEFYIDEVQSEYKFTFSLNINSGVVLSYIYVFVNDEQVPNPYPSLVFTYKYLLNDLDKLMNPSTIYVDYAEFKEIVGALLVIYQSFKGEFLRLASG